MWVCVPVRRRRSGVWCLHSSGRKNIAFDANPFCEELGLTYSRVLKWFSAEEIEEIALEIIDERKKK